MPKLPDVSIRYGAPMGRVEHKPNADAPALSVDFVPLDAGGYDAGGAYWGIPSNLYHAHCEEHGVSIFTRAKSRKAAFDDARRLYPEATLVPLGPDDISDIVAGYFEAALFCCDPCPSSGEYVADMTLFESLEDIDRAAIIELCAQFELDAGAALEAARDHVDDSKIGRTLYYATSGHGIGFSDRDLPDEVADTLDKVADAMPQMTLYCWPDDDCEHHNETGSCSTDCDHGYTYSLERS